MKRRLIAGLVISFAMLFLAQSAYADLKLVDKNGKYVGTVSESSYGFYRNIKSDLVLFPALLDAQHSLRNLQLNGIYDSQAQLLSFANRGCVGKAFVSGTFGPDTEKVRAMGVALGFIVGSNLEATAGRGYYGKGPFVLRSVKSTLLANDDGSLQCIDFQETWRAYTYMETITFNLESWGLSAPFHVVMD